MKTGRVRLLLLFPLLITLYVPMISTAQPDPRWVRFQDGYGKDDVIEDMAADSTGNIYVAGWTVNQANNADYYIAKFNAGGARMWYHLYDGGGDDVARSIALRGAAIVVTGKSRSGPGFGANDDIVTFVLDTAGTIAPDNSNALRFDFGGLGRDDRPVEVLIPPPADPGRLLIATLHADTAAVDTFYIAGTHRDTLTQSDDLLLLKYAGPGLIGAASHHRAGNEIPAGMAIAGDAVYLGSTSIDPSGTIVSYQTVKFDRDLVFGWEKIYSNIGQDVLLGIDADTSGVYVTGRSLSACYDLDVATVRYAPDGTFGWATRAFDCASTQVGTGAILISGEYVYAAGYHANGSQYFRLRKSDGAILNGGEVWGTQSAWIGLIRSYDGSIYAGGHRLYYDLPYAAAHFVKFDSGGILQWETQFDGSGAGNPNTIHRMAASPFDTSIILAGSVTVNGQEDMMIIKYSPGDSLTTGVGNGDELSAGLPDAPTLYQNYPNPFNPVTILRFALPTASEVVVAIYTILGEEVARPVSGVVGPGFHTVSFDGRGLGSGIYYCRLTAGGTTRIRKIVLLR